MSKYNLTWIFVLFFIFSFTDVEAINPKNQNMGEVIAVSVDHIEPISISSNYLQARNYPVMVFLRGVSLGSILFGESSLGDPLFGGLKIRDFTVQLEDGHKYATITKPVFPRSNKLNINPNGEINLGHMVVNLKQNRKESEIPDELKLNLTAKFIFDGTSKFGVFGKQDLILTPVGEDGFLQDPSSGNFWSNRGYLRLEDTFNDEAYLELYDGNLNTISNIQLKEGKEKEYTLRGAGVSFLDNKLRVKLKKILTPETNAILIIDNNYELSKQTVIPGMSPFVGSSWTVKNIFSSPDRVVFKNQKGESIELSGASSGLEDPCVNEAHIDEDFLSQELKEVTPEKGMCTAIWEYEQSLIYAKNIEEEETIYLKIAETYKKLGALVKGLEYYNKISLGSRHYEERDLSSIISELEQRIQENSPSILLDGTVVFLQRVNVVEKKSYFSASFDSEDFEVDSKKDIKDLIPIELSLSLVKWESGGQYAHCEDGSYSCEDLSELKYNKNFDNSGSLLSTDFGLFQINNQWHPGCFDKLSQDRGICSVKECNDNTVADINCNIAAGLELLREMYNQYSDNDINYENKVRQYCTDSNYIQKYLDYEGWDRALRAYNGFGCKSNNHIYVEKINEYMSSSEIKNFEISSDFLTNQEEKYERGDKLIEDLNGPDGKKYSWIVEDILDDKITLKTYPKWVYDGTLTLRKGENTIEGLKIYVSNINYEKAVLISILPGSGRAYGSSSFMINIPIEKRLITWTPEEIDKKIERVSKKIEKMEKVLGNLGNMIKWWKGSCYVTYYALVLKNLKTLGSRKAAITYFTDNVCSSEVQENPDRYSGKDIQERVNNCLEHYELNTDRINNYMDGYTRAVNVQNEYLSLVKQNGVNDPQSKEYLETYFELDESEKELLELMTKYNSYTNDLGVGNSINHDKIKSYILEKETNDPMYVNHRSDLFDLSLLDKYKEIDTKLPEDISLDSSWSPDQIEEAKGIIGSIFKQEENRNINFYYGNSERKEELKSILEENQLNEIIYKENAKVEGDNAIVYINGVSKNLELIKFNTIGLTIDGDTFYKDSQGKVYAVGNNQEKIYSKIFKSKPAILLNDENKIWIFPYPFKKEGDFPHSNDANYVRVYFDEFGNKDGFSIINVGRDGLIDSQGNNDDQVLITPSQLKTPSNYYNNYRLIYDNLNSHYEDLQTEILNKPENKNVININGEELVVNFASNAFTQVLAKNTCQFYMSASDCKIMYNVCDPVMCPTSRFDFGGKRKVNNVISTGIIGSMILGMPNWKAINPAGDMYVPPVCVSGVHAGLENLKQGYMSYQDCLQTAKVDGEYVGVCDEITGLYACEMLWREAIALTDVAGSITDLLGTALDKKLGLGNAEGGEYFEYGKIGDMWDHVQDSTSHFTNEYAASSFTAFTQRSTQGFGTQLCKAAIHGKIPNGGDFLSQLTDPTSPPQFVAWYDKRDHSGVQGDLSTYNIYYHIYAGRDRDIRYNIYLLSPYGRARSVLDESVTFASSRYLENGEYVDKTLTIVDSSEFNQLCIDLDGAVHCGFGKVSSSEAVNALNDLVVEAEVKKNVTSPNECAPEHPSLVPGTTGTLGSVVAPGASGLLESGVIRVCSATGDPDGVGERWKKVGSCGNDELGFWQGDCYLDTNTLDLKGYRGDAVEEFLDETTKEQLESMKQDEQDANERINKIISAFGGNINSDSLNSLSIQEIVGIILSLRDVVYTSESNNPIHRAYSLIGDIYAHYKYHQDTLGCTDKEALNYNSGATINDGSCQYNVADTEGCMELGACNYDPGADKPGDCDYTSCVGCSDNSAINYNPEVTEDDGSCKYQCQYISCNGVNSVDCVCGNSETTSSKRWCNGAKVFETQEECVPSKCYSGKLSDGSTPVRYAYNRNSKYWARSGCCDADCTKTTDWDKVTIDNSGDCGWFTSYATGHSNIAETLKNKNELDGIDYIKTSYVAFSDCGDSSVPSSYQLAESGSSNEDTYLAESQGNQQVSEEVVAYYEECVITYDEGALTTPVHYKYDPIEEEWEHSGLCAYSINEWTGWDPVSVDNADEDCDESYTEINQQIANELDNIDSSLGNNFERGLNFLVNFANHRYEQEGPNSDYIKIAGVSDTLESSANEELLLGYCYTDDCKSRFVSVDDVLGSCDNEPKPMNCIIEYDENDFKKDWLFSFHSDYLGDGEKLWYIKSEENDEDRGEFNYRWLVVSEETCNKRDQVFYQTPGANYELCLKLKETNQKNIPESNKFEEGVTTLIAHADEVGEGDDQLLVYHMGNKLYEKKSPDIRKNKIYEACNYNS